MQKEAMLKSIMETVVATGGAAALALFVLYKIEVNGFNKFMKNMGKQK